MIALALAFAGLNAPHPAIAYPDKSFGRWTLHETQTAFPPERASFTPRILGSQKMELRSKDGSVVWKIKADNLNFSFGVQIKDGQGTWTGLADSGSILPKDRGSELFAALEGLFASFDRSAIRPADRFRYRIELQSTRADFLAAFQTMRSDADALYGGVHPSNCNPLNGCVY